MFGFSRGGYTALVVAGAVPDFRLGRRFCVDQPGMPFCSEIAAPGALALPPAARDARVRAAVVVDPLSLFTGEGLAAVRIPVQLWASERGGDGVLPHDVEAIRRSLPQPPEHHAVPLSGHFVFLAPCSPAQARQMPVLCADDPGFDRQAFHRSFDAKVVAFFRAHLLPAPR
jgi:predicted dienelactone hydrolase